MMKALFAGIDLGTSGCRIIVIDAHESIQYSKSISYEKPAEQTAQLWLDSVYQLLDSLPTEIKDRLMSLAIDGTSGTILLADEKGKPSSSILMYYDQRATQEAQLIKEIMPEDNGGQGASGSLARLMWLLKHEPNDQHKHALHQADFILGTLASDYTLSDENNCLKLGYDVVNRCWKNQEMKQLGIDLSLLPKVYKAGVSVAIIDKKIANKLALPETLELVSGTTDSIAAFIATGANKVGEAVTSLGSTLVVKLISDKPIFSSEHGIYSHRLGDKWLLGGASNSGGNVLSHFFTQEQMDIMTAQIDPYKTTDLDYYPLVNTGERFPIADPNKQAVLTPRPDNDVTFFHGMLEGIANIEKSGYKKLFELGAPKLISVRSVGGGSQNLSWTSIRQRILNSEMVQTKQSEAAFGSAILALRTEEGIFHEPST